MIKELTKEEKVTGQEKREQIINDAQTMKRLSENADFKRFCELLTKDREGLIKTLLNEDMHTIMSNEQNIRLKARIFQIKQILKKPRSLIWQMENLTEVREAIKAKTRVRQAHGTKTGGRV